MASYRRSILFRGAIPFLFIFFLSTTLQAQMFGVPTPAAGNTEWKEITGLVSEEEPLACLVWNESGGLNPEGNESEKWYSDGKLQETLGKLKNAIGSAVEMNGPPVAAQFAKDVGWKLVSKAGFIEVESVDIAGQSLNGSLIVRLGEDEELIRDFLDDAMMEFEFDSKVIGEAKVYSPVDARIPLVVGVHAGHLIAAVGPGQWKKLTERVDESPSTPEWLTERLKSVPVSRRGQFAFTSVESMLKLFPEEVAEEPQFKKVRETLKLDDLKTLCMCSGADATSNISMLHLECEKEGGIPSIMDVPAIPKVKLKELPGDAITAIAVRIAPSKIMEMIHALVPDEQFEDGISEFVEETGLDLEEDIINHLEGTVRHYQSGMIVSPKQLGIVRIKDEAKFIEAYGRINDALHLMAENNGFDFVESEKKGIKQMGVKANAVSVYWALHQGELYISSNSRAIGSHIRKAASAGKSSVLDTDFGKRIMSDSKALGLEGPIMVQHYDLDQITEVVVPLIQGAFNFMPAEARAQFDFGPEDFPPIESLLGLRETNSMMFKSPKGYTGISRYDTPIGVEFTSVGASGVAVGLLLPAVQQVREAARRTSSMNNQRQLALAILNYESANGHFPSAYSTDEDGEPLLSWRVSILPFLDQQELYDEFNHDEPWDSEHNIQLLERMPDLFKNPSVAGQPGWTDYVAPMNEDCVLAAGDEHGFGDITDGSSNTILLLEAGESQQVPWSSPQDMDVEKLTDLKFDNGHPGIVLCVFCDGSTHAISSNFSLEDFVKMCQKSDGSLIEGF